jgi:ActR/RegA family two-component response regulator
MDTEDTSRKRGRLPLPDLHRLLRAAAQAAKQHPAASSSPNHPTIGLNGKEVQLRIQHPGGGYAESVAFLVQASDRSLLVLQQGYVHRDTAVEFTLLDWEGRLMVIEGSTVWCDHLAGSTHVCRVQLAEAIEARRLVDPDHWRREVAKFQADKPLAAVIAHYCDEAIDRNTLKMRLAQTQCRVLSLASTGDLYDCLRSGMVDICALDLNTDSEESIEVLKRVRETHFDGYILLSSADAEAAQMAALDPIGRTHFLRKPIDCDAMIGLLRDLTKDADASIVDNSPIRSTVAKPEYLAEIRGFIVEARRIADIIEDQIKSGDFRDVANKLSLIMNALRPYGFAPLWPTLEAAVSSLQECKQEPERCILKVRRALTCIRRMTAGPQRDGQAKAA